MHDFVRHLGDATRGSTAPADGPASLTAHWIVGCVVGVSAYGVAPTFTHIGVIVGKEDPLAVREFVNAIYAAHGVQDHFDELLAQGAIVSRNMTSRRIPSNGEFEEATLSGGHEQATTTTTTTTSIPSSSSTPPPQTTSITLFVSPSTYEELCTWKQGLEREHNSKSRMEIAGWSATWFKTLGRLLGAVEGELLDASLRLFLATRLVVGSDEGRQEDATRWLGRLGFPKRLARQVGSALEHLQVPDGVTLEGYELGDDLDDFVSGHPHVMVSIRAPPRVPSLPHPAAAHLDTRTRPRAEAGRVAGIVGTPHHGSVLSAPYTTDPFYWDQERRQDRRAMQRPPPTAVVDWAERLFAAQGEDRVWEAHVGQALHRFEDPGRRPGDPRHADLELSLATVGECIAYVANTYGARAAGLLLAGGVRGGDARGLLGVLHRLDQLVRADPARLGEAPQVSVGTSWSRREDWFDASSLPRATAAKVAKRAFELCGVAFLLPLFVVEHARHDVELGDIVDVANTTSDQRGPILIKKDGAAKAFTQLSGSGRSALSAALRGWWGFISHWLVAEPLREQVDADIQALADQAEMALQGGSHSGGSATRTHT